MTTIRTALRRRLTFANVTATLALFIALGGTGYAAFKLPKNSVGTSQLKRGAIHSTDIAKGQIGLRHLGPSARNAMAGQGPAGPAGPQGPAGPKGDAGSGVTGWATIDYDPNDAGGPKLVTGSDNVVRNGRANLQGTWQGADRCAATATTAATNGDANSGGFVSLVDGGDALGYYVYDKAGNPVTTPRRIYVAVYCR